jgi:hypothetical protein
MQVCIILFQLISNQTQQILQIMNWPTLATNIVLPWDDVMASLGCSSSRRGQFIRTSYKLVLF